MANASELILGEYPRSLDDRYRLSVPAELHEKLTSTGPECVLAKERPGCLSLWDAAVWQAKLDVRVSLFEQKVRAGLLEERVDQVQRLGRLLSTRHRPVQLAGRGRLVIPEGFREFLGIEAGGEVMLVGAAICVELWNPQQWVACLEDQMPQFRELFDQLTK